MEKNDCRFVKLFSISHKLYVTINKLRTFFCYFQIIFLKPWTLRFLSPQVFPSMSATKQREKKFFSHKNLLNFYIFMCVTFSICNFILKNILKPIFGSQHLSIRKHTIIHKFMTYSQDLPLCKLCLKSTFFLTTWLCFLK